MKILSLETSAKSVSAAVTEGEHLLAYSYQSTGLTHSRTLMPMVQALLENAGLSLDQLDGFAVSSGPGSFTGLRIGISSVKGLSWAAEKPCCGVSTLEAMAQPLTHMSDLIICAMDARRQQIYNALFSSDGKNLQRLCPDRAIALEDLLHDIKNLPENKIIVGDGAQLCYTFLQEHGFICRMAPEPLRMQSAYGVALAAEHGAWGSAQDLIPHYLRPSQAERERMERLKQAEES